MSKSFSFDKALPFILALLLFIAVLLFFGLCYPHHLHFQEQYQLFLFDSKYITDILVIPGGVADVTGRYLTQFFLYAWIGAYIMAFLMTGLMLLTWRATQQGWLKGLSLLPAIAAWTYICDENALLGGIVALILALLADWALNAVTHSTLRNTFRLITAPLLYWALGPIAILTAITGVISAFRSDSKTDKWFAIGAMFIILIMPLLAQYLIALPLQRLYLSPHYHRYPEVMPHVLWIAATCTAIITFLPATASRRGLSIATCLIAICIGGYAVKSSYNRASENVMSYDFMARYQQWNRIIATADKEKPNNSISCTALNLALGMNGQLANRLFDYNQNGMAGFLPDFVRDPVSPLTTSEVYYQLGLINTAQRYVFEAQEAIMDFQKSGRCYCRLAETNIICGNYEVARKYLNALSKTLFYRTWAQERLTLLHNEEAIKKHPEYGHLRSMMPKHDIFFHDRELHLLLGSQVRANPDNKLAHQYLYAGCMLNQNLYWYNYFTQPEPEVESEKQNETE